MCENPGFATSQLYDLEQAYSISSSVDWGEQQHSLPKVTAKFKEVVHENTLAASLRGWEVLSNQQLLTLPGLASRFPAVCHPSLQPSLPPYPHISPQLQHEHSSFSSLKQPLRSPLYAHVHRVAPFRENQPLAFLLIQLLLLLLEPVWVFLCPQNFATLSCFCSFSSLNPKALACWLSVVRVGWRALALLFTLLCICVLLFQGAGVP